jgi:hypothetical protein
MKLFCKHVDTCTPDYWQGHELPHVQIPVTSETKVYQVKQALKDALRWGDVGGRSTDSRLMSADFVQPHEEKRADRLTRAAYAAVNRLRFKRRSNIFELSFCNDDNAETIYAYFVFSEVE